MCQVVLNACVYAKLKINLTWPNIISQMLHRHIGVVDGRSWQRKTIVHKVGVMEFNPLKMLFYFL